MSERKIIEVGNIDDIAYSEEGILESFGFNGCTGILVYGENSKKHYGILGHYVLTSNEKMFSDVKDVLNNKNPEEFKNHGVIIYPNDHLDKTIFEVKDFLKEVIPEISITDFSYGYIQGPIIDYIRKNGTREIKLNVDNGEWKAWFNKKPKRF